MSATTYTETELKSFLEEAAFRMHVFDVPTQMRTAEPFMRFLYGFTHGTLFTAFKKVAVDEKLPSETRTAMQALVTRVEELRAALKGTAYDAYEAVEDEKARKAQAEQLRQLLSAMGMGSMMGGGEEENENSTAGAKPASRGAGFSVITLGSFGRSGLTGGCPCGRPDCKNNQRPVASAAAVPKEGADTAVAPMDKPAEGAGETPAAGAAATEGAASAAGTPGAGLSVDTGADDGEEEGSGPGCRQM
ncbi:Hypothetical protein POVN_LOCUS140 [uncultured virus]|nr:Hypothetical protein POVN_LOCUS140 [uncultured virus]